ncbi:MAG: hypothetical protein ACT4OY_05355 [Alphaproteobacteria bacterium]
MTSISSKLFTPHTINFSDTKLAQESGEANKKHLKTKEEKLSSFKVLVDLVASPSPVRKPIQSDLPANPQTSSDHAPDIHDIPRFEADIPREESDHSLHHDAPDISDSPRFVADIPREEGDHNLHHHAPVEALKDSEADKEIHEIHHPRYLGPPVKDLIGGAKR